MHDGPCRVRDVMTPAAVAVGLRDGFKDIAERMHRWKVSAVPVLEGDGRVIGVVSEADLLLKEEIRGPDQDRFPPSPDPDDLARVEARCAEELMSTPAVTVHSDATVAEAARIMALRRVKRLPVVGVEGVLEGVVSRADVLKVFLRPDGELSDEIRHDIVDALFHTPGESVEVEVTDGVASLTGHTSDSHLIPLVARLVQGVEGIVAVDCRLTTANVS